jgi:hypothetical protein
VETSADGGDQRNSVHRIPTERSAIGSMNLSTITPSFTPFQARIFVK